MPGQSQKKSTEPKETEEAKHELREFGWLSPMGEFIESPWGEHEQSAGEICEEKGFMEQYENWCKENDKDLCLMREDLTKQQREFLYDYFMGMGDRIKAELYFNE